MLWAVIMAGGVGSRFWPESRKSLPKQFLPFFSSKSLLEETVERLGTKIPAERVIIVTQQDKVSVVKKLLPAIPTKHIIGEPVGRNTAPCAAIAAALARKEDPDAVVALLPADHYFEKPSAYRQSLQKAYRLAKTQDFPVTFGICPRFPHTGYGYLEIGKEWKGSKNEGFFYLKQFCEKPSLKKAEKYFKSGKFLWNSGMFLWRADSLLEATKKYLPAVFKVTEKIMKGSFKRNMKQYFPKMQDISIDYGLMEKLPTILTCPLEAGWNDVGGWYSFGELCRKDKAGNVLFGNTLLEESSGNIVRSKKRLIAMVDVEDLVVVDTEDVLMICPKDKSEKVKNLVNRLKTKEGMRYL